MIMLDRYREAFIDVLKKEDNMGGFEAGFFTYNYTPYKLQWTCYFDDRDNSWRFGINIEFRESWKRIRPRLTVEGLKQKLKGLDKYHWQWMGRPSRKQPNPPVKWLKDLLIEEVNLREWLQELDAIMDGNPETLWDKEKGVRTRPQISIMRVVGYDSSMQNMDDVRRNIIDTMGDMTSIMKYFAGET